MASKNDQKSGTLGISGGLSISNVNELPVKIDVTKSKSRASFLEIFSSSHRNQESWTKKGQAARTDPDEDMESLSSNLKKIMITNQPQELFVKMPDNSAAPFVNSSPVIFEHISDSCRTKLDSNSDPNFKIAHVKFSESSAITSSNSMNRKSKMFHLRTPSLSRVHTKRSSADSPECLQIQISSGKNNGDATQNIKRGSITQFGVLVDKSDITMPRFKDRHRYFSFANAPSGMKLDEWAEKIEIQSNIILSTIEEGKTLENQILPKTFPEKNPVINLSQNSTEICFKRANNVPEVVDDLNNVKSKAENQITVYKAIQIGTDKDFLRSSSMRGIFRANAINPDDARLFTLPTEDTIINDIFTPQIESECCPNNEWPNTPFCTRNRWAIYLTSIALVVITFILLIEYNAIK